MFHELYGGGMYKYIGNTVEEMSGLMCLLHKNLITSPWNKGSELSPKFLRQSVVPSTCAGTYFTVWTANKSLFWVLLPLCSHLFTAFLLQHTGPPAASGQPPSY